MNSVKEFHNKAMEKTELAFIEKMKGNTENSIELFKDALLFELKAIEIIEKSVIVEPTYSILLRSAATLALDCDDIRKAEQLVARALSNNPPDEIAVNFQETDPCIIAKLTP